MRNIDKHVPPYEPFCIWRGAFTSEECNTIVDIGELSEFQQAKVGGEPNGGRVEADTRKTDIVWILPCPKTKWIFEKMNVLAGKINFDKYQLDLVKFDGFQYSKYENGGFYDWHIDTIAAPPDGLYRKLSFSLMLTDPNEYEGGEFYVSTSGDNSKFESFKVEQGDVVAFYSHLPHKVAPVTKGTRVALVTWAMGPKLK